MSTTIQCISPIDGSLYVGRPTLSLEAARAAVARAKSAQSEWAALPLSDRIQRVRNGIARLGEMNDDIVEKLAWQMGRPVRYGGEFGGVDERAGMMADLAEEGLAPIEIEDSASFHRYIRREPHGAVLVVAPWNYPYMTAVNTVVPALIAGNAVFLKHASQTPQVGEHLAEIGRASCRERV